MLLLTNTTSLIYDATLALLYPQQCHVCGASVESRCDGVACASCWRTTHIFTAGDTLCGKCGVPTPVSIDSKDPLVKCHGCDEALFTAARACGLYEGALRASIIALKSDPHVADTLRFLLRKVCARAPLKRSTLLVPVPLHAEREQERGFNQAAVLAAALSKLTGLPSTDRALVRRQHTKRHRAGMDAQARRESVAGAFAVVQPRLVAGESILLIDDVFTTGATVSACALALTEAGAREVLVLTVARPRR